MKLISFDGISLADASTASGIPWDGARGQYRFGYRLIGRPGMDAKLAALTLSERIIPIELAPAAGSAESLEDAHDRLQGMLMARPYVDRTLIAQRRDGTLVQRQVRCTKPAEAAPDGSVNWLRVELVSTDVTWRKTTQDTVAPVTAPSDATTAVPFTVAGYAPTSPIVTITPTGTAPAGTLTKRRKFSIANDGDTPLNRRALRVPFGPTVDWLGGFTPGYVMMLEIYLDGVQVPRDTVNAFGGQQSYAWIVPTIAPGQTLEYEVLYGYVDPDFDYPPPLELVQADFFVPEHETGFELCWNLSSTTQLNIETAHWQVNQWRWGRVIFLSGDNIGEERIVQSNGTDFLIVTSAFPFNPDVEDSFMILMSSNDEWVYDMRRVERADDERGAWYQNRGQSRPSDIRFNTPGCWSPMRSLRNDDAVSQPRTVEIDVGTEDFFAVPSIRRTWQNGKSYPEAGQADSIVFNSDLPITSWRLDWLFTNPNGVGKAFLGSRESTAEGWEEVDSSIAASDTPTTHGPTKYLLTGDQRHLLFALWPRDEEEIPTAWARDLGSWTGGGLSTLFDDSKSWTDDQWIGAVIRITEGRGHGYSVDVTDNDSVHVVVDPPWLIQPNATSRYEIVQRPLEAQLDSGSTWVVGFDASSVAFSPIGAEEDVTPVELTLRLDGGAGGATLPHLRLRVGMDDRRLFLASTEALRIDGERRKAEVVVAATGAVVRDVTAWIAPQEVRTNRTVLAGTWLEALPGAHTVYVVNEARGGEVKVAVATRPGWYG